MSSLGTVGVVTGAASGIGRECALNLQRNVDTLLLVDVRPVEGLTGTVVLCDITDADQVRALGSRVADAGTLRALVHAAGISPEMGSINRVVEVDLVGTARLLDELLPLAVAGTAAVCIASMASQMLLPERGSAFDSLIDQPLEPGLLDALAAAGLDTAALGYAVAKRGVQRLVRREALRWGKRGARVCSVSPGVVATSMGQEELSAHPEIYDLLGVMPVPRVADPREIAAAVAFLLSDDASYITGIDLLVDGGAVAAFYGG